MHTFTQKSGAPQQILPTESSALGRVHVGQIREVNSILQSAPMIGNQATQRLSQSNAEEPDVGLTATETSRFRYDFSQIPIHPHADGVIQAKLAINRPGDVFEQEADRVSEQVTSTPEPQQQPTFECGGRGSNYQSGQTDQKHNWLQTQQFGSTKLEQMKIPPVVQDAVSSPGQPLDRATRNLLESRFGHDFSTVRIHSDGKAAEAARSVNALAYTMGTDVVFGEGQYQPRTDNGRKLLAHELTHVIQQHAAVPTLQRMPIDSTNLEGEYQGPTLPYRDATELLECIRFMGEENRDYCRQEVLGEEPSQSEGAPGPPASTPTGTRQCTQPNSVRLVSSHALSFPGFRTGGGLCAVMEALPRRNLCSTGIVEEVTLASGATCPNSLLQPTLCGGSSTFIPGRNQVRTCRSLSIPTTGFVDRHSVQLRSTSVLHDSARNPRNLDDCTFTCNQRYFIRIGRRERTTGRFQIRYDLAKGRQDGRNVTTVRATKTQRP